LLVLFAQYGLECALGVNAGIGAIAALLIGLAWPDGQARAQHYPPQPSAQLIAEQQYELRPLMPIGPEPNVTGTLAGNPRSYMAALLPDARRRELIK
jgi:hypothetical protein